ncbi:MAG: T9SS type A sorting domain-containing protein [FCB group bacterium]|nr:T9SS type A sorting domain-containing protein [FCB group bacterium]
MPENNEIPPRDDQSAMKPSGFSISRWGYWAVAVLLAGAGIFGHNLFVNIWEDLTSHQKVSVSVQENKAEAKMPPNGTVADDLVMESFTPPRGGLDKVKNDRERVHADYQDSAVPQDPTAGQSEKPGSSPVRSEIEVTRQHENQDDSAANNSRLPAGGIDRHQHSTSLIQPNSQNNFQNQSSGMDELGEISPSAPFQADLHEIGMIGDAAKTNPGNGEISAEDRNDMAEAAPLTVEYENSRVWTIPVAEQVLQLNCFGGRGTLSGTFYYRLGGDTSYLVTAMKVFTGDENRLEYNLPAAALGLRGLEYYFEVSRGDTSVSIGSSTKPLALVVSLTDDRGHCPRVLTKDHYHIVGIPIDLKSGTLINTFGEDIASADLTTGRLSRYRSGTGSERGLAPTGMVGPGRGYWLLADGESTFGGTGTSVRPNYTHDGHEYYHLALDSGWNQLANPLPFEVALDDMLFEIDGTIISGHPDSMCENAAYWYNGTDYDRVTTIPAWSGVFLFIKKAGVNALIRYREASEGNTKSLKELPTNPDDDCWGLHFQMEADGLIDDGNLAGVLPEAQNGYDRYDYTEPPPAPQAVNLAFRPIEEFGRLLRTDFRNPFSDGAAWEMVFTPAADRRLECRGVDQLPDNMEAWLVVDDGLTVQLREGIQITLSDKAASARLLVGVKTYLDNDADLTLPLTFELYQNYPNPFNPRTHIRFTLPTEGRVILAVYNVLGQVVATLIDEDRQPGDYTAIWNGRDTEGRAAASGIYFYRVQAGEFTKTNKMLLLK